MERESMPSQESIPASRAQAQQRVDDIQVFYRELKQLEESQVLALEAEQTQALRQYHQGLTERYRQAFEIDPDNAARQLSWGMRIASLIGALALAASLFFLFFRFWGLFGEITQVLILCAATAGTFSLTMWLRQRDMAGYFSKLAAMIAFAALVLNISMLGHIFNITPSDKALLLWAAYGFFLAYVCDARLLLVAGIACLMAFIAMRVGTYGGGYWLSAGDRPENFFPAAILIFIMPLLFNQNRFSGFTSTYRISGLLALFIPILILSNWGRGSYLDWSTDVIEGGYQLAGFVLAGLMTWLGVRKGWRDVANTAVTFFVIFLYTKMFDWWWEIMPKYLFFFVFGLTAVLILIILQRLRRTLILAQEGV